MAYRRKRKKTRSRRRRRNPMRTTGALVINPRRRRRRKTTRQRRRRKNAVRRRRPARRRRTTARQRRTTRRHPARRRRTRALRRTARSVRRLPRRKNRRRRNTRRRKKNPMTQLKSSLKKIPVVGPILAQMAGFVGPAVFGAVGVEPTMMAAKFLAPYVPQLPASLFYAGSGLLLAAVVQKFAPVSPALKQKLAIGIASAAGGVAYYKWRTEGGDTSLSGEYGRLTGYGDLEINLGDGMATSVVPFGRASYGSYGDLEIHSLHGYYADAELADAFSCPDQPSYGELEIALAGPGAWGRQFGRQRFTRRAGGQGGQGGRGMKQSQHAGQEGHRWGWLIKLVGFKKFQQIMKLPASQRKSVIADIKEAAKAKASQLLAADQTAAAVQTAAAAQDAAGWGAYIYGA